MPSDGRMTVRLRLEDAVALAFFFFYLTLAFFFQEMRQQPMNPINVLVVIPGICLLLIKELVHYFVAGNPMHLESAEGLGGFVRPYWVILRDWLPFLMVLLMYFTLWGNATHMVITHDRDLDLIAWDQRLFGFQASVALQKIMTPPLTAWMEFSYFFHLPNIPIVACFLYIWRPRERFREMMCGVLTVTAFGLMGYLLVPGVGPMYALHDQFTVPLNNGQLLQLQQLKGKKLLIVNTASDCGYTNQYGELQELQTRMSDRLVVIGFPANDFKEQEKGSDEEISSFCRINYGVSFPLAKKSTARSKRVTL